MKYKIRYKLTMVEVADDEVQMARAHCLIGYLDNEEELKQWAERNNGELAKENI